MFWVNSSKNENHILYNALTEPEVNVVEPYTIRTKLCSCKIMGTTAWATK